MMSTDHNDRRWLRAAVILAGLAVLLWANYYLRHTLEDAPSRMYSFMEYFYTPEIPIVFAKPWWRLLLPLPELTGAWAATTLLLTYLVERVVTPAGAWELYNAIAILVAFGTSWMLFRSAVFSFTLAICIGFGTQFYHAYAVTGGIASYLLVTFNMLLLFTMAQLVRGARPLWLWIAAFAAAILLNVLGYEGWLDVLVVVWVASPLVYVGLTRLARGAEARRLVAVVAVLTLVGVAYVVMKVTLGFGQTQGAESDVIFNYDSLWPMADDVIGNLFTHTYLSVSNFLPPSLVGANAFYLLGPDYLIEAQHNYHEPFSYLVVLQQVFFWRYYAGAVFAVLLYLLWRVAARAWTRPTPGTIAMGVFLVMILAAGAMHTIVKFRPMNSMPVMTYHVTVGVLGVSLALSWLLMTAWQRWPDRRRSALVVALAWGLVFYGALARPPYLAFMAAQAGLGENLYPNPGRALVEKLGGTYAPPAGLARYQLMPYSRDEGLSALRSQLAELPGPLPPVTTWEPQATGAEISAGPAGSVELLGDDTQFGYQLMSPAFPVAPGTNYIVRVRFEALEGRVCVGILTGNQQGWLVAPDGGSAEYPFNSGDNESVRVVIANCFGGDVGNPRSRVRVAGGSYGMLMEPVP